jgi:hypothetical protein
MNYFRECKTKEEVKAEFKRLAKLNHPDKGGNVETMQMINALYSEAIKRVLSGSGFTAQEVEAEILNAENYKKAIDSIINCEGLIIELCGSWLWVSGKTFAYKAELKQGGFFWASKKCMWYFRGSEQKSSNTKTLSIDKIRSKHGSKELTGSYKANYLN